MDGSSLGSGPVITPKCIWRKKMQVDRNVLNGDSLFGLLTSIISQMFSWTVLINISHCTCGVKQYVKGGVSGGFLHD